MILTPAQAEAIYSAMCILNNIGGRLTADINEYRRVVELPGAKTISIQRRDHWGGWIREELHDNQAAFATAYGLLQG